MKEDNIRFAFAVNETNKIELKHFGDADKYLIYEFMNGEFNLILEEVNEFKLTDEASKHGSEEKGNSIINLLQKHRVNVLVSKQFGRNIRMVHKYFVPVIIHNENLPNVQSILEKNMKWIIDELDCSKNGYKLFSINKGIMKSSIK